MLEEVRERQSSLQWLGRRSPHIVSKAPRLGPVRSHKRQGVVVLQAFLISIFCCFFATSADFGNLIRNTPLSNFASTFAGSGSNGRESLG